MAGLIKASYILHMYIDGLEHMKIEESNREGAWKETYITHYYLLNLSRIEEEVYYLIRYITM